MKNLLPQLLYCAFWTILFKLTVCIGSPAFKVLKVLLVLCWFSSFMWLFHLRLLLQPMWSRFSTFCLLILLGRCQKLLSIVWKSQFFGLFEKKAEFVDVLRAVELGSGLLDCLLAVVIWMWIPSTLSFFVTLE